MSLIFQATRAFAFGFVLVLGSTLHCRELVAEPLAPVILELENWLDENSGLPRAEQLPTVRFSGPEALGDVADPTMSIGSRTRGIYEPKTQTITLITPWSASDPVDLSVLLHELVHHRQPGIHQECPSSQEPEAYRLQQKWLAARGIALDVNWVAVGLTSGCRLSDVHP